MDWLLRRQPGIEQRLARRHLHENTLVLYDLTSTYVEGTHCPLARRGYSRDGKKNKLQIVFGLLCSPEGCPVAVEVFEGNTSDPKTVACQVDKLRFRFGLARVVLVGDRGMLTSARIREDLAGVEACAGSPPCAPPPSGNSSPTKRCTPPCSTSGTSPKSKATTGERLIVCRNPRLAVERRRKRQELARRHRKTPRTHRSRHPSGAAPLRGKDESKARRDPNNGYRLKAGCVSEQLPQVDVIRSLELVLDQDPAVGAQVSGAAPPCRGCRHGTDRRLFLQIQLPAQSLASLPGP